MYFFCFVRRHFWPAYAYARLGVVYCCWHVAVGMLYVAMVSSLFISVSQSPTSRCGLPSKSITLSSVLFLVFTNWWSQKYIWWNVLDKSLVTGGLEFSPDYIVPVRISQILSIINTYPSPGNKFHTSFSYSRCSVRSRIWTLRRTAPSRREVTVVNCSDHSTSLKKTGLVASYGASIQHRSRSDSAKHTMLWLHCGSLQT